MRPKITGYPTLELHEEQILIVVKTYLRPSFKYRELVCTAGITENGKWVRLYPINYRYLNYNKWYKKYQWILWHWALWPLQPKLRQQQLYQE